MRRLMLLSVFSQFPANCALSNTPQNLGHILPEEPARQEALPLELSLNPENFAVLQTDSPLSALVLDNNYALWMAGQKHLWVWRFEDQSLQKIEILRAESTPLGIQEILLHKKKAYAQSATGLYQIELSPLKIFQYKLSTPKKQSLKIQHINDEIYWITTNAIYKIIPEERRQTEVASIALKANAQDVLFIPSERLLWILEKTKLTLHNLSSKQKTVFLDFEKSEIPKKMSFQNNQVFLLTSKNLYRFEKNSKPIEKISALKDKSILDSYLDPSQHNFLLNNGTWEMHSINNQKSLFLNGIYLTEKQVSLSNMSPKSISLVIDGEPKVFQLPTGMSL